MVVLICALNIEHNLRKSTFALEIKTRYMACLNVWVETADANGSKVCLGVEIHAVSAYAKRLTPCPEEQQQETTWRQCSRGHEGAAAAVSVCLPFRCDRFNF